MTDSTRAKLRFRGFAAVVCATLAIGYMIALWPSAHEATSKEAHVMDAPPVSKGAVEVADRIASATERQTSANSEARNALLVALQATLRAANVIPNEALLTFRDLEARDSFLKRSAERGIKVLDLLPQLSSARVRYERVEDLCDAIATNGSDSPGVEGNLWLSIPGSAQSPPTDPNNQGGREPFGYRTLEAINAMGDRSHWGEKVTVAVLDTGVLPHPTFAEGQVTSVDLVNDGQRFNSHGTSVASIIAGQNSQAAGVAPGAQILDIRVAGSDGYSASYTLAKGIVSAVDSGAQVINISLGGYGDSPLLAQAVDYASRRGAVIVAAAGNDGYGQLAIPAAYESVISVGSVDTKNRQAYFSNSGAGLDLAAPGVGVVSAWDTDKIAFLSGTSQSSALVAGAAATYLSWGVLPNAVAAKLKTDARPVFNSSGVTNGPGILTIKPPTRR